MQCADWGATYMLLLDCFVCYNFLNNWLGKWRVRKCGTPAVTRVNPLWELVIYSQSSHWKEKRRSKVLDWWAQSLDWWAQRIDWRIACISGYEVQGPYLQSGGLRMGIPFGGRKLGTVGGERNDARMQGKYDVRMQRGLWVMGELGEKVNGWQFTFLLFSFVL